MCHGVWDTCRIAYMICGMRVGAQLCIKCVSCACGVRQVRTRTCEMCHARVACV